MKLKQVDLMEFRHFTSLRVDNIPETARIIVLVGPNGCGKSSFLEAINFWYLWTSKKKEFYDKNYHGKKDGTVDVTCYQENAWVYTHDSLPSNKSKMVYMRSAYRNEFEFRTDQLINLQHPSSVTRTNRLIDNDATVSQNYSYLVSQAVRDIFVGKDDQISLREFRENFLKDIRITFQKLFPELSLNDLDNPLNDRTFHFTKGKSKGYSYMNLSGGERAAFDLILDYVIALRLYDNTLFCIDEPELHISTRIQSALLKVLYELLPVNCQLIVATHSIGMMRQAQDYWRHDPDSVVFLDFSNCSFDSHHAMEPSVPTREFWKKAYRVALDDLVQLVTPARVVICEGEPNPNKSSHHYSHDARCYDQIFKSEFPETQFVSSGSAQQVLSDHFVLVNALENLVEGIEIIRIIDRDDRSDQGIKDLKAQGFRVLGRRNLESYLYDDEVLCELAKSVDQSDSADKLISKKTVL